MKLFRWFKKPRAEVKVFQPDEFGDIDDLLKDLDSAPPLEPVGNSLTTSIVRIPVVYKESPHVKPAQNADSDSANASDNSYATIAADNKRVYRAAVKEVLINKLRSY